MRLGRLILAFLFMAAWLWTLVRFGAFFHRSKVAMVLMAYIFLLVTERWNHWFRRLRPDDEFTKLNLDTHLNHG
jgi:hypothetical protein